MHLAKHDYDTAIADYNEAIRLNSQLVHAYGGRGVAREHKGDHDGAIADYSEALCLDPKFAYAYHNRGITRETKGDFKGAIADYQRYLDLGGGKQNDNQAQVEQKIQDLQQRVK